MQSLPRGVRGMRPWEKFGDVYFYLLHSEPFQALCKGIFLSENGHKPVFITSKWCLFHSERIVKKSGDLLQKSGDQETLLKSAKNQEIS